MPMIMKTGIDGLDRILEGGFLYHNSILFKGAPGSGKTTLGIQMIYNGITEYQENGIIVLFEQFPQQLFRDLSSYEMDLRPLEDEKKLVIIFAQPDDVVASDKILDSPLISRITDAVYEIGAKRILIDSITDFINIVKKDSEERERLLKFINSLKSLGLTPIMTAERENEPGKIGFDEYLSDCVLLISNEATLDSTFQMRQIEVRKTRGHSHIRGRHPLNITSKGIEIYPRLSAKYFMNEEPKDFELTKIPTGIAGLDSLLSGGCTKGTSNIIAGMPGTYKSTIGAQFIAEGAKNNEPGLFITLSEDPDFIVEIMKSKGIELRKFIDDGMVKIIRLFPKEFYMEEMLYLLINEIESSKFKRIVIDSLNDIERSIENPDSYKDYISSMLALFFTKDITSLFIQKIDKFSGNTPLANIKYSSLFDGIIYVGILEIESAVHKVLSVLKMRGGDYTSDLREIVCGKNGLAVLDKFIGLSGILAGNPQGQYKRTVEDIFQPLYFVKDFIDFLGSPDLEASQRSEMAENVKTELNKSIDRLKKHFDVNK